MVTIKNGFDFNDPCGTGATYRVWTKEPRELEGKCVATDISRVRSVGLLGFIDDGGNPSKKIIDFLDNKGVHGDDAILIKGMIDMDLHGKKGTPVERPLGAVLNPEAFAVANALYDLTSVLSVSDKGANITDIVIRDVRVSQDQFCEGELRAFERKNQDPSKYVGLELITDLYSRGSGSIPL